MTIKRLFSTADDDKIQFLLVGRNFLSDFGINIAVAKTRFQELNKIQNLLKTLLLVAKFQDAASKRAFSRSRMRERSNATCDKMRFPRFGESV